MMKTVNALKVRTKFGEILDNLEKSGEPILLSKSNVVRAAIIPIELFKKRFVDLLSEDALNELLRELTQVQSETKIKGSSQASLRLLRGELK